MEQSKKVRELKEKLLVLEKETQSLIALELTRINRTVGVAELPFVPFGNEVEDYRSHQVGCHWKCGY